MADPGHAETGAPQIDRARQAETQQAAHGILHTEAKKRLADPALAADHPDRAILQFGVDIKEKPNPHADIPKKEAGTGKDLYLADDAFAGAEAADKPIPLKPGDIRISGVVGNDPDDPEKLLVVFKNADDNDVVLPGTTGRFAFSVTRDQFLEAQFLSETMYEELPPEGQAREIAQASLQAARFDRGQGDAPLHMPSPDALQAIRDEYGIAAPTPEPTPPEAEPQTPLEVADAIIAKQISELIDKLHASGENELKGKDRKAAQKLLFTLKVAASASGPSSAVVKNAALRELQKAVVEDFSGAIENLKGAEAQGQVELNFLLETALDDPESGLKDQKDIDQLKQLVEDGKYMELIQDKRTKKLSAMAKEIFGNVKPDLKQLLKDSHLSTEQQKAVEQAAAEAEKSGDHSKLWWLLLLLALPLAVPVAGALVVKGAGDALAK